MARRQRTKRQHIRLSTSLSVLVVFALGAGALTLTANAAVTPPQAVVSRTTAAPAATSTAVSKMAWGAYQPTVGSQSQQQAVQGLEAKIGRQLGVTRVYYDWTSTFPNSYVDWLAGRGTQILLSVKPGSNSWHSIATAPAGSALYNQIVSWATRVKSFGHPMYFTFNHEPEASGAAGKGTSADFIAAWDRIHAVFKAQGVTNAKFLWIMTGFSFQVPASDHRAAAKWYPGDSEVDALGADAGNQASCDSGGHWTSLADKISGFVAFGKAHPSKPLWLPEWDSVSSTTNSKAAWITAVEAMFKQPAYSQFAGASYFNSKRAGTTCDWTLSGTSLTAFAAMGKDPFYAMH